MGDEFVKLDGKHAGGVREMRADYGEVGPGWIVLGTYERETGETRYDPPTNMHVRLRARFFVCERTDDAAMQALSSERDAARAIEREATERYDKAERELSVAMDKCAKLDRQLEEARIESRDRGKKIEPLEQTKRALEDTLAAARSFFGAERWAAFEASRKGGAR